VAELLFVVLGEAGNGLANERADKEDGEEDAQQMRA